MTATVRLTGSNTTVIAERPATWYGSPDDGRAHAFPFPAIRTACRRERWTVAWSIVGPIEAVDRGSACGACLALTADRAPGEDTEEWGK